jgi:hypothetical protein
MAFQVDRVCRKLTKSERKCARARARKFRNDVVDELSEPNVSHLAVVRSSSRRALPSLRLKGRDSPCLSAFPSSSPPTSVPLSGEKAALIYGPSRPLFILHSDIACNFSNKGRLRVAETSAATRIRPA